MVVFMFLVLTAVRFNLTIFFYAGSNVPFPVNFNDIGYDFINRSVEMKPLFHAIALQQYILLCTQVGFRNKLNFSNGCLICLILC